MDTLPKPNLKHMAAAGLTSNVKAIMPTVTNVNNVSISCGALPSEHGLTGNSYYNERTGEADYLKSLGAAEIVDRFQSVVPNHISDIRYTFRFRTLQPVNGSAIFEATAKLQPSTHDLSDSLLASDASLRITISRKLAFRTRYEWKRDSAPAPGVKSKDDRSFTVSLLLSW